MPSLVQNTPDAAGTPQGTEEEAQTPQGQELETRSNTVSERPQSAHSAQEEDFEFPVIYEGTDDVCSFCREPHRDGERVVRLACRHVFHAECWQGWCDSHPNRCCPNC